MFEKFQQWIENRHQYARDWQARTGGKVVGYFCTYAPEELMYAAGILPVRILGSHEPLDVTEPHIFGMYCPFCRDCLAQGLKGRFDYLDGIMLSQSCLHLRQAFTSWKLHVPISYSYYLYMPAKVQSPHATAYLAGELEAFRRSLEEWTGKTITTADLDRAIGVYNTNRRLMREIYELRKQENPPLTGLEAMQVVISGQMTDKEEHNRALAEVLERLPARRQERDQGVRLMIVGSENDDMALLKMIESLDATIVIDDHCTGSRYFWNQVEPQENRLRAIADRYVRRVPCPSKDWEVRTRLPHVLQLARDYRVQGAILLQQKFCDPHECDMPPLAALLEENGIPTYFLELDVTVPLGQFKIRVEAFLEMLRADELF